MCWLGVLCAVWGVGCVLCAVCGVQYAVRGVRYGGGHTDVSLRAIPSVRAASNFAAKRGCALNRKVDSSSSASQGCRFISKY